MEDKIKHIYIDSRCMFNYASYYIYGIRTLYPNKYSFNLDLFQDMPFKTYNDYRTGMGLIVETESQKQFKIFIDFNDWNTYQHEIYEWCDIYAVINISSENLMPKMLTIGPSFGITVYNNYLKLFYLLLIHFISTRKSKGYKPSLKYFIRDYLYTIIRRKPYQFYQKLKESTKEDANYCFSMSTLWYDKTADKTTNYFRGIFIKQAAAMFKKFEGGFFYIPSSVVLQDYPEYTKYKNEYKDFITSKRISLKTYLKKTAQSALVFNTPSVASCIGWKLGEYLSLGKTIISTPIDNLMPGNFKKDIHYKEVVTESDIQKVISEMNSNPAYRKEIADNAFEYFETYLSPTAVMRRIINQAQTLLNKNIL